MAKTTLAVSGSRKPIAAPCKVIGSELSFALAGIAANSASFGVEFAADDRDDPARWVPSAGQVVRTQTRRTRTPVRRDCIDQVFRFQHAHGHRLDYTVRQIDSARFSVRAAFTNGSERPVSLRRFILCDAAPDSVGYGEDPSSWWLGAPSTTSRRIGNLAQTLRSEREIADDAKRRQAWVHFGRGCFAETDPRRADGRWRAFHDAVTLYRSEEEGLAIAAVGEPVADVMLYFHVGRGRLGIEISSEMNDILVEPGQTRESQEVAFIAAPYDEALREVYEWIARTHSALPPKPVPTGWCSWYGPYIEISREHIERICTAIEHEKPRLRPDVVLIDDKWQRSYGDWQANDRFPLGMAETARRIEKAGCTPGIWMTMVRAIGKPDHWYQGAANGTTPEERAYIDPTHPEVEAFIREAVRARVAEGYRYFKFDFNHLDRGRLHDRSMTRVQAIRHLFGMLREEVGPKNYLLACIGEVERAVVGFADATRIGSDTCHAGAPNRLCDGLPANPMNLSECARATGQTALSNGRLFTNDPDVLMVGPEHKGFLSYVGLLGGLAFNSKPLDQLTDVELRILERFQPVGADRGHSLNGGTDPWHRLFGFVREQKRERFAVASWYNNSDQPQRTLFASPALDALGPCHIWDFWTETYLGVMPANRLISPVLPPHGAVQYRLTPAIASGHATLIGSNLHITAGATEVRSISIGKSGVHLELDGQAGARNGRLFFWSPRPLQIRSLRGAAGFLARITGRLYVLVLSDREVTGQSIRLRHTADGPPTLGAALRLAEAAEQYGRSKFLREGSA